MYLIKVNGNYNIIINDINVAISSTHPGVLVEDEVFNNSVDAKNLASKGYIIVEKVESANKATLETITESETKTENAEIFVAGEQPKQPEDVFVKEVPKEIKVEETKTEEVTIQEETVTPEVKEEVTVETTEKETTEAKEVEEKEETTSKKQETKKTVTKRQSKVKK